MLILSFGTCIAVTGHSRTGYIPKYYIGKLGKAPGEHMKTLS